jgi:hypothetical protein
VDSATAASFPRNSLEKSKLKGGLEEECPSRPTPGHYCEGAIGSFPADSSPETAWKISIIFDKVQAPDCGLGLRSTPGLPRASTFRVLRSAGKAMACHVVGQNVAAHLDFGFVSIIARRAQL